MRFQRSHGRFLRCVLAMAAMLAYREVSADEPLDESEDQPIVAGETWQAIPNVAYTKRPSGKLLADLYVPNGDGPFPAVLMIHGGAWMSGSKWHMIRHARKLVEAGYVVASINYRLAPTHPFPAQIEDCREAFRWLADHADEYKVDRDRIAAYGYSAGGHLACLMGVCNEEASAEGESGTSKEKLLRPCAIVAGGAPCDFRDLPPRNTSLAYFLGGSRAEKPDAYINASPAAFVSKDDPPVLFFHGDDDSLVPLRGVTRMRDSLKGAGVRTEMYVVPGKGHIATFLDDTTPTRAIEFLRDVIPPREAAAP